MAVMHWELRLARPRTDPGTRSEEWAEAKPVIDSRRLGASLDIECASTTFSERAFGQGRYNRRCYAPVACRRNSSNAQNHRQILVGKPCCADRLAVQIRHDKSAVPVTILTDEATEAGLDLNIIPQKWLVPIRSFGYPRCFKQRCLVLSWS